MFCCWCAVSFPPRVQTRHCSVQTGQTGVVETPIGNELEVFLVEPLVAVLEGITPLEVETPPTGQERGGGFG